jgi:hypothetical protein
LELGRAVDVEGELVDVAPPPRLPRFEGLHQRVRGLIEVRGGMPTGRAVATADVAADHAHPEMNPPTSQLETVLAAIGRRADLSDLIEVVAELLGFQHGGSFGDALPRRCDSDRW